MTNQTFQAKITYRRHNRLSVMTADGRIYHIINLNSKNNYSEGATVHVKVIDEAKSHVEIII